MNLRVFYTLTVRSLKSHENFDCKNHVLALLVPTRPTFRSLPVSLDSFHETFAMNRLSRATLKGRESVFVTGPERGDLDAICPPSLFDCIANIERACEEASCPCSIELEIWSSYILHRLGLLKSCCAMEPGI